MIGTVEGSHDWSFDGLQLERKWDSVGGVVSARGGRQPIWNVITKSTKPMEF